MVQSESHRLGMDRTVGWMVMAVALAMLVVIAASAERVRREITASAQGSAVAATRLLSEHAARLFDAADQTVARAAEQLAPLSWDDIEGDRMLWERLDHDLERFPYLGDLWLNDEEGRLRLSTVAFPVPPSSAADRDYFLAHRSGAAGPFISERFTGRITSTPAFRVSRRMADGAGNFRGTIAVTIGTQYFSDFYRSIDLPLVSSVAMVRAGDRQPIAAYSRHGPAGSLPEIPAETLAALTGTDMAGMVRTADATTVFRRFDPWPVYAVVRIDPDLVEREWRLAVLPYALAGCGVVLAVVSFAVFTVRRMNYETAARRELEQRVLDRTATLQAALAQTEEAVQQKDLLMRESNHRIKNSLQLVSSILTMHGLATKNADVRDHFAEAGRRVAAIAEIHELLYRSNSLSSLCFDDYLENLCRSMAASSLPAADGWEIRLRAKPVELPADQAVALGIIVGELLTNSAKYAYPQPGPKPVALDLDATDGGQIRLTIADNGVGLPPADSQPRGTGLGMRIVRALCTQVGARLVIDATPPGVRHTLIFTPRPV